MSSEMELTPSHKPTVTSTTGKAGDFFTSLLVQDTKDDCERARLAERFEAQERGST